MSEAGPRRPERGPAPPRPEHEHPHETQAEDWDEAPDWDETPEADETAAAEPSHRDVERQPRPSGAGLADILGARAIIGGAIVALIAIVLIAISLLLIAGENHYRSCVYAAQVKAGSTNAPLARLGRTNEVENCSRSPF